MDTSALASCGVATLASQRSRCPTASTASAPIRTASARSPRRTASMQPTVSAAARISSLPVSAAASRLSSKHRVAAGALPVSAPTAPSALLRYATM